ncbi:MAG: HmuY family protein [Nitrospinota bacterium]|nr:HmuY family protein [Nitrospinota bacterium]
MLLGSTLALNFAMNFMGDNIEDFENRPLPPIRPKTITTVNPVLKVNAQSKEKWTLVDFSTQKTFQITDPEKDRDQMAQKDWDLGFQRTKVISNGGITNPQGKVAIANLGPVDFNSVLHIPQAEYVSDTRSWGNINNPSIVDWYLYRTRTHNIESKRNVYLIKTGDGHLKLKILNYYCQRPESDCQTSMCSRDEAACLTLEYFHIPLEAKEFPVPLPSPQKTAKAEP